MNEMVAAKVAQAVEILREQDLPLWIAQFARESYDHPQPVGELVVGTSVTWPAAFIITADGTTAAIVGTGDVDNVRGVGAYREVIGYVQDVGPPLRDLLARFDPARIGVSYSEDDDSADNITHGMFLNLQRLLADTPFASRLESAERVLVPLRARKIDVEIERIRAAIGRTEVLFREIESMLRRGVTEREVFAAVHRSIAAAGTTTAWDERYDPVVNFGPESSFGHAGPGDRSLEPGMLVHVDLGVKLEGYCSDLQRTWYLLREGEASPPEEVEGAFDTLRGSLEAGFEALRPGVPGHAVDAAARRVLAEAGYGEPEFALGHQLGQSTHDAGCLLGPRWARYGSRPDMPVEAGNVFALEFAVQTSAGTIGLEEDVLVTPSGAQHLSPPQRALTCLHP